MPDLPFQQSIKPKWQKLILPFAISLITLLGLLAFVRVDVDYGQIFNQINYWWLGLAFLKLPLVIILWMVRWEAIFRFQGIKIAWRKILAGVMIRSFFNNLTPGLGIGGEPAGAYYLAQKTSVDFKQAIASTATEKMIQGMALLPLLMIVLGLAIPSLPFTGGVKRDLIIGLSFFFVFVLAMIYISIINFKYSRAVILWFGRLLGRLSLKVKNKYPQKLLNQEITKFETSYRQFLKNKKTVILITVLTIIQAGLELGQHYLIFKALGFNMPFWLIAINTSALKILSLFAILPGGSGFVEGLNFGLYAILSRIPQSAVVAQTIIFRILDAWLLWIIGGIVSIVASASMAKKIEVSNVINNK